MKAERYIACYKKGIDMPEHEVDVSPLKLSVLKSIFTARSDDPFLYLPYDILEREARLLTEHAEMIFDFTNYYYSLECESGGQGFFPQTPAS